MTPDQGSVSGLASPSMMIYCWGMRIALLLLAACFTSATAHTACEYRPEWRARDVATYVTDAETCLTELKDGYWFDEAVEREVFDRVNAAREDAGLEPLALRPALLRPARLHSFDMGQDMFFSHDGPDGRSVSDRVSALDRTLVHSELRENIATIGGAFNWTDAGEILHNILYNSNGHRKNMLSPRLTHMAIGVVRTEDGAWITQVFARVEGEFNRDVPAAVSPGGSLPSVTMADWRFSETIVENDGEEQRLSLLDPMLRGEARLLVVGTRAIDDFSYQTIKLSGPSITLVD
ncbi:MAG: CAP domain-containing protein [Pseudomonadota bacterium]